MPPEARYLVMHRKAIAGQNRVCLRVVTDAQLADLLLEGWLVVFTDPLPNWYDDPIPQQDDGA